MTRLIFLQVVIGYVTYLFNQNSSIPQITA